MSVSFSWSSLPSFSSAKAATVVKMELRNGVLLLPDSSGGDFFALEGDSSPDRFATFLCSRGVPSLAGGCGAGESSGVFTFESKTQKLPSVWFDSPWGISSAAVSPDGVE